MFACRSATSVPANIIKLNTMKALMWDIAQAEAYANQYLITDSTKNLKTETLSLYQKVFALYKTNKETFETSLKYYEANPPKNKILLDSLMQYATRMKERDQQKIYASPMKLVR
jgi:hypothetical protein